VRAYLIPLALIIPGAFCKNFIKEEIRYKRGLKVEKIVLFK